METSSSSRNGDHTPWSTVVPNLPHLPKWVCNIAPLWLGLFLFFANNLAPLAAFLHPRPGYVPLFMPRTHDSAQYLTWIEAYKNSWTIPDYHAPWSTEPALHVPLMWILAKASWLTGFPTICVYLGLEITSYVLAFYGLALLLRVFMNSSRQAVLAVLFMICAVSLRSFILFPALLFEPRSWVLIHSGYDEFLGNEGFFQGVACGPTITVGTAGTLFALALFGRYFFLSRRRDLWAASLITALSGFLHPFEFIPVTTAAAFTILWKKSDWGRAFAELSILGVPASAVILFYFLPTLAHPWLKVASDLNRLQTLRISHHEILTLGLPLFLAVAFAFLRPKDASHADLFLGCYVVIAALGLFTTFLPWPQHFKDGLDYAAAVLIVRRLDQTPGLMRLWANRNSFRLGVVLVLIAGTLMPHLYFRYVTYRIGTTATEEGQSTAVAPLDEVRVIAWLREHSASGRLILAPMENAPWMSTVPMHSFASHWIFSLTIDQQGRLSYDFFRGALSDATADSLLKTYGVRYVLIPIGSPALQYVRNAQLRLAGQKLLLYEFPQNEIKPFPKLKKVSPGRYVWNPG